MGQSSIIFAVAATLLVAIVLLGTQRSNNESDADLAVYHNRMFAREAALTGLNLTVRRLVDDPDHWFSNTAQYEFPQSTYNGAQFQTTVTSTHPDTVFVVSVGTHHSRTFRVESRYTKGLISGGLAELFNYALVSDDDLHLSGNTEILAVNGAANADVHANGDLSANGSIHIEGYGSFGPAGNASITPAHKTDDFFDPNNDSNGGDSNVYSADEIELPLIDASRYSTSPPADLVFAGDAALFDIDRAWLTANGYPAYVGTEEHPFLMYVGGDLEGHGNIVIDGIYFQAVVAGEIEISGNTEIYATSSPKPGRHASQAEWDTWIGENLTAAGTTPIGFFAEGDITFGGNVFSVGQLYSNSNIRFNGGGGRQRNIIGGIVSATADITLSGSIVVQYAQLATTGSIEEFFSDIPEGVRMLDYAEF